MDDRYCIFLGYNFDDIEAITVINLLRRSDILLDIYGIGSDLIQSFVGMQYKVDHVFIKCSDVDVSAYKGILLPGGPGVAKLLENNELLSLVRKFNEEGKLIFAICGAPVVLERAGILKDRKYTCLPAVTHMINSGFKVESKVVIDGNIITSKALGTSLNSALKLIEVIKSKEKSDEIARDYYIEVVN